MSRVLLPVYLILEIAAFVAVSKWIGLGWAILALGGLFVVGVVAAAWEMRRLTARALADASVAQESMAAAPVDGSGDDIVDDPATAQRKARAALASAGTLVVDSAMLMVGCVLLAVPGFVSTAAGLLLILPPTRWAIRAAGGASLARWFQKTGSQSMFVVQRYGVKYPGAEEQVIDHDDLGDPARDPRFQGSNEGGFTTYERPDGRSLPPGSGDVIDEVPDDGGSAGGPTGGNPDDSTGDDRPGPDSRRPRG